MVSCSGSLVQSRCGEGGALQTNVTGVCGEHSQCSSHTGFAPARGPCGFPVYTTQAPGCSIGSRPCVACGSSFRVLHKSTDSVGPAFCAFPSPSSSGSQEFDEHTLPGCSAPYPSLSFHVRLLGAPCVCSGELVSSRDPPSRCQSSRISGSLWLETGSPVLSLVGDAISGAYFAPFPSPSASCLQRGMGRSTAS